jgi:hypothetical protein
MPTGVVLFLVCASAAVASGALVSQAAREVFTSKYYPLWQQLLVAEGSADYPFPATSAVGPELIPAGLKGAPGIAVSTDPSKTVSEGQGYAMFAAAMAGDTKTLKGLAVGWQAMAQGVGGGAMLGGCPEVGKRAGCLCDTVSGADMPAWRFPLSSCAGTFSLSGNLRLQFP